MYLIFYRATFHFRLKLIIPTQVCGRDILLNGSTDLELNRMKLRAIVQLDDVATFWLFCLMSASLCEFGRNSHSLLTVSLR